MLFLFLIPFAVLALFILAMPFYSRLYRWPLFFDNRDDAGEYWKVRHYF